ncbi:MAG: hypothetical protein LUQ69_10395, partial [Methanoregulaceae archaeon]|nr:hypothetical protein [Methanoregulaceae archaeon]
MGKTVILSLFVVPALVISAFSVLEAQPASRPEIICRPAPNPITINGFLNDWGDIKLPIDRIEMTDPDTSRGAAFRNKAWCHLFWDAEKLYLAFIIEDSRLMAYTYNNGDNLFYDDCIEIFMSRTDDSALTWSPDVFHLFVGLNNNITEKQGIVHVPGKGKIQQIQTDDVHVEAYVRLHGTLNDNRDEDSGYIAEMAVTWESLGMKPAPQTQFRFNFAIDDLDVKPDSGKTGGEHDTYFHYAQLWSERLKNVPRNWATVTLEGSVAGKTRNKTGPFMAPWLLAASGILLALAVAAGLILLWLRRRSRQISAKLRNEIDFKIRAFIDE